MENKQSISKKKKYIFYTIIALIPVAVFILSYIIFTGYRSAYLYLYIKGNQRGWTGNVHKPDVELGFAPVQNSEGSHIFPIGPNIQMRYDENGFRVPVEFYVSSNHRPLILALGCSFTYGDAVLAEEAFPYLVGKSLDGTCYNAGVCGYSLSQMLILAKRLLPIHKPDYLIVQCSDWLLDRAQTPFAPSRFGRMPAPFFYSKGESFELYPPVFLTKILDLNFDRYRNTPKSWTDALSFYFYAGLPLSIHGNLNMIKYLIKKSAGIIPDPTDSRDKLIKYVYGEISKTAEKYGAKTVIVFLGKDDTPVDVNENLFPPYAILVKAHDALLCSLSVIDYENYQKKYFHWRGIPPEVEDEHPNKTAHRIIADIIVSTIIQAETP